MLEGAGQKGGLATDHLAVLWTTVHQFYHTRMQLTHHHPMLRAEPAAAAILQPRGKKAIVTFALISQALVIVVEIFAAFAQSDVVHLQAVTLS